MSGGFKVPQPQLPAGANRAVLSKLGQRVSATLKDPEKLYDEPKQLDPEEVLVDPCNRGGAPPRVMYCHTGILAGFNKNGYDPTTPKEGICIESTTPRSLSRLLERNQ